MMNTPHTTSASINKGFFLGFKDRIVLSTTLSKGLCDIQIMDFDEEDPFAPATIQAQVSFDGRFNALVSCSPPNQANALLVLATSTNKGVGKINVIELKEQSTLDSLKSTTLLCHDMNDKSAILSAYSSLAYDTYSGHLYASSDDGDVHIRDFQTFQTLHSFKADASGVRDIVCLPTGEILIAGCSYQSQIQLWDSRSNLVTKSFSLPLNSSSNTIGLTGCLAVSNDTVICGTSEGYILKWDIRNDRLLYDGRSHNRKVTSLRVHPSKPSIVFSTSSDGQALCTYMDGSRSTDYGYDLSSSSNTELITSDIGPLTSCDVERQSQTVLITSSLGGLWRHTLAPVWQNQMFISPT